MVYATRVVGSVTLWLLLPVVLMPPAPAWKMASATAASVPCAAGSPSASRLTLVRPLDDGRETEGTGQPLSGLSFREPLHRSYPRDLEHHDHREGVRRAGHQ